MQCGGPEAHCQPSRQRPSFSSRGAESHSPCIRCHVAGARRRAAGILTSARAGNRRRFVIRFSGGGARAAARRQNHVASRPPAGDASYCAQRESGPSRRSRTTTVGCSPDTRSSDTFAVSSTWSSSSSAPRPGEVRQDLLTSPGPEAAQGVKGAELARRSSGPLRPEHAKVRR